MSSTPTPAAASGKLYGLVRRDAAAAADGCRVEYASVLTELHARTDGDTDTYRDHLARAAPNVSAAPLPLPPPYDLTHARAGDRGVV